MDVGELIEKKKAEIIAETRKETEGLEDSVREKAVEKLEQFAVELKMVLDMHPIGATDLLRVIEKGGVVYQKTVDIEENLGCSSVNLDDFLERIGGRILHKHVVDRIKGKQRATIIIEPVEE